MEKHATGRYSVTMIVRAGHFVEDRRYRTIRPTGASDWLFLLTLEGRGRLVGAAGTVVLERGLVAAYPPGVAQDYGTDPKTGRWEFLWSHFDDIPRLSSLVTWPTVPDGAQLLAVESVLTEVVVAMREVVAWSLGLDPDREPLSINALERSLLWCRRAAPREGAVRLETVPDSRVVRAKDIVIDRFREPLSVADVAASVGLSPSRFSHLFKRDTGMSLPRYLEAVRIQHARDLLAMTDHSIGEVAYSIGYDDPLYFSKRFREANGACPSEWRGANRR